MKEFTRIAWASERAREVWEPRVQAIQRAWSFVELQSVVAGVRSAALVYGEPGPTWRDRGLVYGVVAPNRYAVARTSAECEELRAAYDSMNDLKIGKMLGFPDCCRKFFNRVWNFEKKRDTTLSMADREMLEMPRATMTSNILGRWLGVRLVMHLPCSWHCHQTESVAWSFSTLWPKREYAWAEEILGMPVEYSALHGIAIITFPIVRVVTSTDYTPATEVLQRKGAYFPVEAPRGLKFPFRPPMEHVFPLTLTKSFKRSLEV